MSDKGRMERAKDSAGTAFDLVIELIKSLRGLLRIFDITRVAENAGRVKEKAKTKTL